MNPHCPFERPIVAATHACSRAISVTRRDGAGVDCDDAAACARCRALQEFFLEVGAEVFGEVEDRTKVPHSTLQKIQLGGLAGVCQCLGADLEDLGRLAQQAAGHFEEMDRAVLSAAMQNARVRARRR